MMDNESADVQPETTCGYVRKVNTMNASVMNVPAQEMLIRDVIP